MSADKRIGETEIEAIGARLTAARAMVSALCQPRGTTGARSWIMRIPAEPDYDPDLVITASLRDVERLLGALDGYREDVAFTQAWYAVRIERLRDLSRAHGIRHEVAAILANGTADANEPPTYAQMLNTEFHRVDALRAALTASEAARGEADEEIVALSRTLADLNDGGLKLEAENATLRARVAELERDLPVYLRDHEAACRLATYMSENRDALEYYGCGLAPDEAIKVLAEMVSERAAVCPNCISEEAKSDEDRCCLTCGVDLIVVADTHSSEMLTDWLTEHAALAGRGEG